MNGHNTRSQVAYVVTESAGWVQGAGISLTVAASLLT